jgi:hypothetical protein
MALSKATKARIKRNKASYRRMPPWRKKQRDKMARDFFPMTIVSPEEVGCTISVNPVFTGLEDVVPLPPPDRTAYRHAHGAKDGTEQTSQSEDPV